MIMGQKKPLDEVDHFIRHLIEEGVARHKGNVTRFRNEVESKAPAGARKVGRTQFSEIRNGGRNAGPNTRTMFAHAFYGGSIDDLTTAAKAFVRERGATVEEPSKDAFPSRARGSLRARRAGLLKDGARPARRSPPARRKGSRLPLLVRAPQPTSART